MSVLASFLKQPQHCALVEEYLALESAEDKLTWLMERAPIHAPVPPRECTLERRIPGCLSGLWLGAQVQEHTYQFSCASESQVIQGIGSFLCDLYSNRVALEIRELGASFATELKLDGLLTLTRRRGISSIVGFILHRAELANEESPVTDHAA